MIECNPYFCFPPGDLCAYCRGKRDRGQNSPKFWAENERRIERNRLREIAQALDLFLRQEAEQHVGMRFSVADLAKIALAELAEPIADMIAVALEERGRK